MTAAPSGDALRRRPFDLQDETRRFTALAGDVFRSTGVHSIGVPGKKRPASATVGNRSSTMSQQSAKGQYKAAYPEADDELLSNVMNRRDTRSKFESSKELAYLLMSPACSQLEATKYLPQEEMVGPATVELLDNKERVRGIIRRFKVSESARKVMCADVDEWVKETSLVARSSNALDDDFDAEKAPWKARGREVGEEEQSLADGAVAVEMSQLAEQMTDAIGEMREFGFRMFTNLRSEEDARKWQLEVKSHNQKHQGTLTDFVVDCSLPAAPHPPHTTAPPERAMKPFPPIGYSPLPKELFLREKPSEAKPQLSPRKQTDAAPTADQTRAAFDEDRMNKEVSLRRQLAAAEKNRLSLISSFERQVAKLSEILGRFRAGRRHEKRLLKEALEALGFAMPWVVSEAASASADGDEIGKTYPIRAFFALGEDEGSQNSGLDEVAQEEYSVMQIADEDDDAAEFLLSNISSIIDTIRIQEKRTYEKNTHQRETVITSLQQQVAALTSSGGSRGNARSFNDLGASVNAKEPPVEVAPTSPSLNPRPRDAVVALERDAAIERSLKSAADLAALRVTVDLHEADKKRRLALLADTRTELDATITDKEMLLSQLREKEREISAVRLGMMKYTQQQIAENEKELADRDKESEGLRAQIADIEELGKKTEARQDKEIDGLEKTNEGLSRDITALLGYAMMLSSGVSEAVDTYCRAGDCKTPLEAALRMGEAVTSRCSSALREMRGLSFLGHSSFSRLYAKMIDVCLQADTRLLAVQSAHERAKGGDGLSGLVTDLRANLQAANAREEALSLQIKKMADAHMQKLVAEESLREETVAVIRVLQAALANVTRATTAEQLRACELVMPFASSAGAARRAFIVPTGSPLSAEAEPALALTGEIALAAFAAVKQKILKLVAAKTEHDTVVLDTAPMTFQVALDERTDGLRRIAVKSGGLQHQLRLMRCTAMSHRCLVRPARDLIATLTANGEAMDADLADLVQCFTHFEAMMRESAALVLTSLVRFFKFQRKWDKLSRQSTLLSTQCATILDRAQFAFQRTDDVDAKRQVAQRLSALRKHRDSLVPRLEAHFQRLAVDFEQISHAAAVDLTGRIDAAIRLLREADAKVAQLFGARISSAADAKQRQLDELRLTTAHREAEGVVDASATVRHVVAEWAADAERLLCGWQLESAQAAKARANANAAIQRLQLEKSDVLTTLKRKTEISVQEAGNQTVSPAIQDQCVNTTARPLLVDKEATAAPLVSATGAQASVAVGDTSCQTIPQAEAPAPATIPQAMMHRRSSASTSPDKRGTPTTPVAPDSLHKYEALLASSTRSDKVATADTATQTEAKERGVPEGIPTLVTPAPDSPLPPGNTILSSNGPAKMARHRRQISLAAGNPEKLVAVPSDLTVHGDLCPRFNHHHRAPAAAASSPATPPPPAAVNATATQTDVQLLYDYVAVVSKMMLPTMTATAPAVHAAAAQQSPPAPSVVQTVAIPAHIRTQMVTVQPQDGQNGQWHSFFKSRRPVSAKR